MPAERVAPVTSYTAVCEREDGWWVVTVPELESGRVTQARTLDEVPATVADLVATMTGADPASVEVNVTAHDEPGQAAASGPQPLPEIIRRTWGSLEAAPDFIQRIWRSQRWSRGDKLWLTQTYISGGRSEGGSEQRRRA